MPHDITIVSIGGTKLPHAFVRNLVVVVPPWPVPGIEERIGCRLELLMGNEVNGAIGIKVMIGATGNSTQSERTSSQRPEASTPLPTLAASRPKVACVPSPE